MISEDAKAKLRRLMELREARDGAKKTLETAEAEYREHEADVYEALEALRDPNDPKAVRSAFKVYLGEPWGTISFNQRETYYGRVIDDEAALEHFERRAMIEEVSAPKFVKARINEIVRDALETDGKMPPGIDYYANRGVTITRPKGS